SELRVRLLHWIKEQKSAEHGPAGAPSLTPEESVLRCETCHDTKDRHVGQFGKDCAACHGTATWTIATFRHPSPRSFDCAQCHQAPARSARRVSLRLSSPSGVPRKGVRCSVFSMRSWSARWRSAPRSYAARSCALRRCKRSTAPSSPPSQSKILPG